MRKQNKFKGKSKSLAEIGNQYGANVAKRRVVNLEKLETYFSKSKENLVEGLTTPDSDECHILLRSLVETYRGTINTDITFMYGVPKDIVSPQSHKIELMALCPFPSPEWYGKSNLGLHFMAQTIPLPTGVSLVEDPTGYLPRVRFDNDWMYDRLNLLDHKEMKWMDLFGDTIVPANINGVPLVANTLFGDSTCFINFYTQCKIRNSSLSGTHAIPNIKSTATNYTDEDIYFRLSSVEYVQLPLRYTPIEIRRKCLSTLKLHTCGKLLPRKFKPYLTQGRQHGKSLAVRYMSSNEYLEE